MSSSTLITEADIFADVIDPEAILRLSFREPAKARMRELLDRNNRGTLTPEEQQTLERYLRVGQFLDALQAKTRLSLQDSPSDS